MLNPTNISVLVLWYRLSAMLFSIPRAHRSLPRCSAAKVTSHGDSQIESLLHHHHRHISIGITILIELVIIFVIVSIIVPDHRFG